MAIFHQPAADIGSHPAQSNNRYLHEISRSPGIGVQWTAISAKSNVLKTPSNPLPAQRFRQRRFSGPGSGPSGGKAGKNRQKD
jgi:hypothetical protein